ncbi:hypothetical protein ACFLR1_07090 [Bacteroidota bacterium]
MTNKQEKVISLLMAANAALFVGIFLLVGYYNRLAADDFHFLVKTKELGIWDSMLFYYNYWIPRWSASLVRGVFLSQYTSPATLFSFHATSLILGVVAIKAFLHGIIKGMSLPIKAWNQWILAIYLLGALFYSGFAKGDTWYWIASAPSYLWGCFAALLGGSFLMQQWSKPIRYPLVTLLFLYAGGASESVAISTLAILFYLGFITHGKNQFANLDRQALHLATIACFIGFGIDISSPATKIRYAHLPQFSFQDKVIIGFWNYFKLIFIKIPATLPTVILFVSPFAFFGRKQLRHQFIALQETIWNNRKLWGISDILIALMAFSLAFAMGEIGPERAWLPLTFMVLSISVVITYQLGTWFYIKTRGKLFQLVVIGQVLLFAFQGVSAFNQIPKVAAYAASVDQRMNQIIACTANDSIMVLKPLPDAGWLFSAEISNDTNHFSNKHLKLFFQNKYTFVLEDTLTSKLE